MLLGWGRTEREREREREGESRPFVEDDGYVKV
jgi:hypothetical protein